MPAEDLKALLERIHTRLDQSFVGIGRLPERTIIPLIQQQEKSTSLIRDRCKDL